MTTFEKLQIKIKKDTGLELENFKRTYHGCLQKSSGFSWVANLKNSNIQVGSMVTATELLKKDKIEIIPDYYGIGFTELT